jgi:hypothetical protein
VKNGPSGRLRFVSTNTRTIGASPPTFASKELALGRGDIGRDESRKKVDIVLYTVNVVHLFESSRMGKLFASENVECGAFGCTRLLQIEELRIV